MMEAIKTSKKVEFDVIYADGTRRHVSDGVLIEAEDQHMIVHIGASKVSVIFAAVEALTETIAELGLSKVFMNYIMSAPESEGGDNHVQTENNQG